MENISIEKYESIIEILESKTENLEQAYHEILCEKKQLVSENAQLRHTITSREKLILELENEVSHEHIVESSPFDRQKEYELEARIDQLENMIKIQHDLFNQQLTERDAKIDQLRSDLRGKHNELDDLCDETNRQSERIMRLEQEAIASKQKLDQCEIELDNGKKCVELLLCEITQMETHLQQMNNSARDLTGANESRYSFCSPGFMSSTKRTSSPSTGSQDSGLNETSIYSEILNELGVPKLNLDSDGESSDLTPVIRRTKKPKGRLEMCSPQITTEYVVLSPADVPKPEIQKPTPKNKKLVKCFKRLVKNVTRPNSRPLRRCESSVDVIRSHATQFRF